MLNLINAFRPSSTRPNRVYSVERGFTEMRQERDLFVRSNPGKGINGDWSRSEGDSKVSVRLHPFGMEKFTITPTDEGRHVRRSLVDVEDCRYTFVEDYILRH